MKKTNNKLKLASNKKEKRKVMERFLPATNHRPSQTKAKAAQESSKV